LGIKASKAIKRVTTDDGMVQGDVYARTPQSVFLLEAPTVLVLYVSVPPRRYVLLSVSCNEVIELSRNPHPHVSRSSADAEIA